jgi:hypothetical protein
MYKQTPETCKDDQLIGYCLKSRTIWFFFVMDQSSLSEHRVMARIRVPIFQDGTVHIRVIRGLMCDPRCPESVLQYPTNPCCK